MYSTPHLGTPDTLPSEDLAVTLGQRQRNTEQTTLSRQKIFTLRQRVADVMKMSTGSIVEFYNTEENGERQHLRCVYNKIVQNSLFLLGIGKGTSYRYDNISGNLYKMHPKDNEFEFLGNYNLHLREPNVFTYLHKKQLLTFLDPDTKEVHHFRVSQCLPRANSSAFNVRISKGGGETAFWFALPVEGVTTGQKLELRVGNVGENKSLIFLGIF